MHKLFAFLVILAVAFAAPAAEPEPEPELTPEAKPGVAYFAPGLAPTVYSQPIGYYPGHLAYNAPVAAYPAAYPAQAYAYSKIY